MEGYEGFFPVKAESVLHVAAGHYMAYIHKNLLFLKDNFIDYYVIATHMASFEANIWFI
jgi:hypothetical protein